MQNPVVMEMLHSSKKLDHQSFDSSPGGKLKDDVKDGEEEENVLTAYR